MGNRRKPRNPVGRNERVRSGDQLVADFASTYRCPDCDSIQVLRQDDAGFYVLNVQHDDGCPYYAGVTRKANQ